MLECFPVVMVLSSIFGFLAGLGVGGGSLLILWLTVVVGMDHPQARIYNLLFFIPCAVISSLFRIKQGQLQIKKILPAVLAGCMAAAIFTFIGRNLELSFLRKVFGGLLLITGAREFFYKEKPSPR